MTLNGIDSRLPLALVVDDDRYMRTSLRQTLEESGYAVIEADSGSAAVVQVHRHRPDVVLLDIVMPGMDGFATCKALRSLPGVELMPILMVTALEDVDTINRAYSAGATDYVPKPVNSSLLRHHLRYVLRASRHYGELLRQEQRLADAQRIARLGNFEWDPTAEEFNCSQEMILLLGLDTDPGRSGIGGFLDRIHPDDRETLRAALMAAATEGAPFALDHRMALTGTALRFFHTQGEASTAPDGKGTVVSGTIQDVTDRKVAEEKLLLAGKVFDHSSEIILITDGRAEIIDVNPAFCRLTGHDRESLVGSDFLAYTALPPDGHEFRRIWESVTGSGSWRGNLDIRRTDGSDIPTLITINAATSDKGEVTHCVAIATDISQQLEAEKRLKRLENFDPLTDLPNRLLFQDRLEQAILNASRSSGLVALLLFDLDNFKEVNDSLGLQAGDQALRIVARRISEWVRKSDTVARLGSDEFAVVLRDINKAESGDLVAQRILELLATPLVLDGKEFFLTASIGIALYPDDGREAGELAQKAGLALVFAKKDGKNRYHFFSEDLNVRSQEKLLLKNGLRRALDRDELLLHYQPKFDSNTGLLTGMEALARWQPPEGGLIPPLRFIPIAEETGMILPLGEKVLRMACLQNRLWRDKGFIPFRVAVNLSALQFRDRSLVAMIVRVLEETGMESTGLELEITESSLMQDTSRAIDILGRLREMGVRISLDDFGTGYSSLSYLKRLPLDALKIDYSFVRNIFVNAGDAAIVRAIIAMAHSLKLKVIAEGVETEEQRVFLREQGCDEVQGYQVVLPQPAEVIERFIPREQAG